ncbi:hypothetical protein BaRGS_00035825, partial [Batillaria attramentaria]
TDGFWGACIVSNDRIKKGMAFLVVVLCGLIRQLILGQDRDCLEAAAEKNHTNL